MKRIFLFAILVGASATNGCPIKPLKPIIPLYCKDLKPECVCDAQGKNCKWQWTCIQDDGGLANRKINATMQVMEGNTKC
jgi:hypothetical protein